MFVDLGHIENLKSRFKKRSVTATNKYVPQRLKVSANGEGSQMCGYLKKRQSKSGKWKGMWFVLKDRVLYAYKASEDTAAVETFPVLGFKLDTLSDVSSVYFNSVWLFESQIKSILYQTLICFDFLYFWPRFP